MFTETFKPGTRVAAIFGGSGTVCEPDENWAPEAVPLYIPVALDEDRGTGWGVTAFKPDELAVIEAQECECDASGYRCKSHSDT